VDKIYMTFVQAATGSGGSAAECLSHAGTETVFWRHLFSTGQSPGPAGLFAIAPANHEVGKPARRNRRVRADIHARLEAATWRRTAGAGRLTETRSKTR